MRLHTERGVRGNRMSRTRGALRVGEPKRKRHGIKNRKPKKETDELKIRKWETVPAQQHYISLYVAREKTGGPFVGDTGAAHTHHSIVINLNEDVRRHY